jgi:hypothetical protein
VSLPNALHASALLTIVLVVSSVAYSQQETCPCPVRDSQNQGQSLADIAKQAKKNAPAKQSITDDDMES